MLNAKQVFLQNKRSFRVDIVESEYSTKTPNPTQEFEYNQIRSFAEIEITILDEAIRPHSEFHLENV